VTVGIGVLCENGNCAILASDTRVTYRDMNVSPHDWAGKQYPFPPFNLAAAIAGSISSMHAVVSEFAADLKRLLAVKQEDPEFKIVFEHIRNALERARKKELRRLQACAMESELGASLDDWLAGKLPTGNPFNELALQWGLGVLNRVKEKMPTRVGIIVAGFILDNPIFMRGIGAEPVEEGSTPAIYVVGGQGACEAQKYLIDRKQSIEMGIARSLMHVHEAMKVAKNDKGVGEPSDYVVMRPRTVATPNGMLRFKWNHPQLEKWSEEYKLLGTEALELRFANDLVNGGLYPERIQRSQWLGPKALRDVL